MQTTEKKYIEFGGLFFNPETDHEIMRHIFHAYNSKQRVRIFYGDTKTGRDWLEEFDTIGIIGRSTGEIKIPLLIKNKRSLGGGGILTHCIVKITEADSKRVIYHIPNYYMGTPEIKPSEKKEYDSAVYIDGKIQAQFKTKEQAIKYISFLKGERNIK